MTENSLCIYGIYIMRKSMDVQELRMSLLASKTNDSHQPWQPFQPHPIMPEGSTSVSYIRLPLAVRPPSTQGRVQRASL